MVRPAGREQTTQRELKVEVTLSRINPDGGQDDL